MGLPEEIYPIFAIVVLGVYWIWESKKESIPEIIRKVVYWICYLAAIYIFLFVLDWGLKFLVVLLIPLMSCGAIFGRWELWDCCDSFKDFLMEYYQSDGLWLLSLFVIILLLIL